MNHLGDDEAIGIISELSALEIHDCPNKEKLISDCVMRLKRDKLTNQRLEVQNKIKMAQDSNDDTLLTSLMRQLDSLNKEFNTLNKQRS